MAFASATLAFLLFFKFRTSVKRLAVRISVRIRDERMAGGWRDERLSEPDGELEVAGVSRAWAQLPNNEWPLEWVAAKCA